MLPPRLIRRLLLAPLVVVIAGALLFLTPAVAVLSLVFNLVRRRTRPERPRRSRVLRVACLALAWSVGETAALTVLLGLWIASGFGGRLDTEPYRTRHYGVMKWFLDLIYRVAERACGLRVTVTGPAGAASAPEAASLPAAGPADTPSPTGARPLIVFSRHAGPGDSLLIVHHLLSVCGLRPRVVMKATLQLDPSIDIVANRVPNVFVRRSAKGGTHTRNARRRQHTEQIRRLAASLRPGDALVLFPEGGNWTPQRWRRAIDRLRKRGHDDLADRAAAMPNVLPPRDGGASAAIEACRDADVIFVAHTGLDRLVSVRDVWRSLLTDMEGRARWWRVPAASVPRGADHDAQVRWLYDWWERIDAWITAENTPSRDPGMPRPA
jgi:1-acyl-sn-glycerol-3-phosphate acyltransferase